MDILKLATEWAKEEIFSAKFFILFGFIFILATIGFWQLGKTDLAKAFIFPTLVAGILLLVIGSGLYFTNKSRIKSFTAAYNSDASAFVKSEMSRLEKTMLEYKNAVFRIVPIIIILAALFFIMMDKPIWRAISVTTMALMVSVLLVDINANARMEAYKKQLELVEDQY